MSNTEQADGAAKVAIFAEAVAKIRLEQIERDAASQAADAACVTAKHRAEEARDAVLKVSVSGDVELLAEKYGELGVAIADLLVKRTVQYRAHEAANATRTRAVETLQKLVKESVKLQGPDAMNLLSGKGKPFEQWQPHGDDWDALVAPLKNGDPEPTKPRALSR